MKQRKQVYGNENLVRKNIWTAKEEKGHKTKRFYIAPMQIMGCDMNPTSYSIKMLWGIRLFSVYAINNLKKHVLIL